MAAVLIPISLQRLDKDVVLLNQRHSMIRPRLLYTNAHMVCITNRQAGSGGDMPMNLN
jgi:hypothetical protein